MNPYSTLIKLLKSAPTFDYQDRVIDTAIRIAQNENNDIRINNEVLELIASLQQENLTLKQTNFRLNTQIQQLSGNLASAEGNQTPSNLEIYDSSITPGGIVVQTDSVVQPVTLRNENYIDAPVATLSPHGYQLNSPKNT